MSQLGRKGSKCTSFLHVILNLFQNLNIVSKFWDTKFGFLLNQGDRFRISLTLKLKLKIPDRVGNDKCIFVSSDLEVTNGLFVIAGRQADNSRLTICGLRISVYERIEKINRLISEAEIFHCHSREGGNPYKSFYFRHQNRSLSGSEDAQLLCFIQFQT